MKKNVYTILILCLIPLFFADAYTFTRTLTVGNTGEDVFELQKFLNTNPITFVSETGIGSPGNESYFFGEKTKDAVVKLQNLYATEILTPYNLSKGTGFVGQSTLSFLNSRQTNTTVSPSTSSKLEQIPNTTTTATTSPSSSSRKTPLFLVNKTSTKPGKFLIVGSQEIISNVTFFLGSTEMRSRCYTEYTCKLGVVSDTAPGTYKLHTNDPSWGSHTITVLDSSERAPEISSHLKSIKIKESNTIKGDHLSENITIYTMFGVFKSKTKNNSFILEFPEDRTRNSTTTFDGLFYIQNENGLLSDTDTIRYEI